MGQVCPAVAAQLGRPDGQTSPRPAGAAQQQPARPKATTGFEERAKGDEKLLDKYTLGKVLGQGAFGVVYSCKKKGSGEEYAVKMIDQVETPVAEIKQEVEMLRKLKHPCVVMLHDVYYEKVFVCMVLEIYRGGDMIEGMQLHWKAKGVIPVPVIQNMSKMMFQGVDWLHQNSVIHRDLKGDNYLQDRKELEHPQCRVYLSDFGTVMSIGPTERLRQKCGTKTYWAPEFYQLNYGMKVDVWGLGVVIFGMVTGRFPFKTEDDVRTKAVKIPGRVGKDGEAFLLGTLQRDESKRLSARQAIEHPFLSSIKSAAETQEPWDKDFSPEVKEVGANAGIAERRKELVERLENAANKKDNVNADDELVKSPEKLMPCFETVDKRAEKKVKFEWWTPDKVAAAKFVDETKAKPLDDADVKTNAQSSEGGLKSTLEGHNIRTSKFGEGQAKTFVEFATEIQGGQARLMLDATKHKCIVRVVDLVLLRIVDSSKKKFLIKTGEKYPDGRKRSDINQLPGTKKLPHENGIECARRVIKERLHMEDCGIQIDFKLKECFEDDEDSPSYPGVRTVYRKEIFECALSTTSKTILERLGLAEGGSNAFDYEDDKQYTHFHQWMTDSECTSKKVKLRAPADGTDVSALVFPPIGLNEEELQLFLEESKVDVTQFGKDGVKTLQEFSDELVKGESQLVRRDDNSLIRIVDVLILKVTRKDGSVIVEAGEERGGVAAKDYKPRLPAVKRRADENMFWAAHRVMSKVLKINENIISLDPSAVTLIEEESTSRSFGDLPTIYRRRVLAATLCE